MEEGSDTSEILKLFKSKGIFYAIFVSSVNEINESMNITVDAYNHIF